MRINPLLLCDFYKWSHPFQVPPGITKAWSNWIPRRSRLPEANEVVVFGMNYFVKRYLMEAFEQDFFDRSWQTVLSEYRDVMHDCLGVEHPNLSHIAALHELGYLPIQIRALPEGSVTGLNIPHAVFSNTHPDFAWLPQYLETLASNILWKPATNASTARRYRKIGLRHARRSGEKDLSFIDWQFHDFSYRGLSGTEDAMTTGMAHLTSFSGTDNIPAILAAREYYGAKLTVGGSVPATEHWVMCAWIASVLDGDGELEGYKSLISERYPNGIVSIVSDTRSLWDVLQNYVPALKQRILKRNGKTVFRPDSGHPVNILCGAPFASHDTPEAKGALRLLAQAMGTVAGGGDLPMIDHAGLIYGDAITEERSDEILRRTIDECKLSPFNQIFGIGSFTYQFVTRDTFSWKLAPAAMEYKGKILPLEKKPVTDDGTKHSYRGLVAVYDDPNGGFSALSGVDEEALDKCAFERVFQDGVLRVDPKFDTIRERVRAGL